MNILLVGYMGSGKSTVGRVLAQHKKMDFIDLDDYIVQQQGCDIPSIFSLKGELFFRKIEREALLEVLQNFANTVIAVGGGTPCYFSNMEDIVASAHFSCYIQAKIPTLVQRLWNEKMQRPMISHLDSEAQLSEFVGKHLFERAPFYQKAKATIQVDDRTLEEIVQDIDQILA